ncbi:MAG: methyltransferase domain-containing protein [Propionibacteriales bacterium]|nr:methyltransferase domain-containing protein [Propionibacteriales bacterium]
MAFETFETEDHYARLADSYDANWAHTAEYVSRMSELIADRVRIQAGERVADVGAGTGLFLRAFDDAITAENPIACIDPSRPMLDQLPDDARLTPVQATAEQVAAREVRLPDDELDVILMKEVIHHVSDIDTMVKGLAAQMAHGGRFLVVTLPPQLDYPLFEAALQRFGERQPEPDGIAGAMRAAGLEVEQALEEFPVRVSRDHYIELVGRRWMSVLSTFTDEELADGLDEMRRRHPQEHLEFADRFAFILGVKP